MKFYNRVISQLLGLGAPLGPMALLTVDGRNTGKPTSTPVAITPGVDGWRLTSVYGDVDWVKNLRASGEATITARGRRVPVHVRELTPREAASHLRQILADAGRITHRLVGPYYPTSVEAPIEEWVEEAERHPMFLLVPPREQPAPRSTVLRLLVSLLILGVVVQVFLAGLAIFDDTGRWELHGRIGIVVEAIALAAAIVAIATRRVGARWLTVGIFFLITLQHGTVALGSIAGALHPVNALLMLTMALVVRRRLRPTAARSIRDGEPADQFMSISGRVVGGAGR